MVKSADGDWSDGKGDFLITRNDIFKIGKLYSPRLSAEVSTAFSHSNSINLLQIHFNNYYTSTVKPTILGEVIEMGTEEYIDIINDEWNLVPKAIIIYNSYLNQYIRPRYLDLLKNPQLTN